MKLNFQQCEQVSVVLCFFLLTDSAQLKENNREMFFVSYGWQHRRYLRLPAAAATESGSVYPCFSLVFFFALPLFLESTNANRRNDTSLLNALLINYYRSVAGKKTINTLKRIIINESLLSHCALFLLDPASERTNIFFFIDFVLFVTCVRLNRRRFNRRTKRPRYVRDVFILGGIKKALD